MNTNELKLDWEFFKDNICSERAVAYARFNGRLLLEVFEARQCYYTHSFIGSIETARITYHDARALNTKAEEENPDSAETLFASLKHACEYFEQNFFEQREKVLRELGAMV